MDTNGKAGDIGYQYNPAILLSVFPFQYQPEHQSRQETGESVDFCFNSREPKGVAEGIGQCTYNATGFDSDDLLKGFFTIHYYLFT